MWLLGRWSNWGLVASLVFAPIPEMASYSLVRAAVASGGAHLVAESLHQTVSHSCLGAGEWEGVEAKIRRWGFPFGVERVEFSGFPEPALECGVGSGVDDRCDRGKVVLDGVNDVSSGLEDGVMDESARGADVAAPNMENSRSGAGTDGCRKSLRLARNCVKEHLLGTVIEVDKKRTKSAQVEGAIGACREAAAS